GGSLRVHSHRESVSPDWTSRAKAADMLSWKMSASVDQTDATEHRRNDSFLELPLAARARPIAIIRMSTSSTTSAGMDRSLRVITARFFISVSGAAPACFGTRPRQY